MDGNLRGFVLGRQIEKILEQMTDHVWEKMKKDADPRELNRLQNDGAVLAFLLLKDALSSCEKKFLDGSPLG